MCKEDSQEDSHKDDMCKEDSQEDSQGTQTLKTQTLSLSLEKTI